eukprot:scaffold46357_cov68-Attheya_sp.AAC.1
MHQINFEWPNNEEIGYVVIERGHGSAYGIEFEAGVTAPSAIGWVEDTDGYPHQYDVPFSSPPEVAVISMATMYGGQGVWAALAGSPSDSASHIAVTVDEDLLGLDIGARGHISESIEYCSFESQGTIYLSMLPT